jgi:hypothetical protein
MAEQYSNGHDPTRLDRIEGLVEVLVNRHSEFEEEHRHFAQEHRQLLTAQVVLTDRIDKLTDRVDKLAASTQEGFAEHKQAMRDFDERLNALIAFIDGRAGKNPPQ